MQLMSPKEKSYKIIWFFLKNYKYYLLILVSLSILAGIFGTANIAVLYPILTYSLDANTNPDTNIVFLIIRPLAESVPLNDPIVANSVLFIILAILAFLFEIIYAYFAAKITSMSVLENKRKLFDKYMISDYQFFLDNKQGELLYKIHNAPSYIAVILDTCTKLFADFILSLSVFILLLLISFKGTLVSIVIIILYYYFTKYLSSRISYITGKGRYEAGQRENVTLNEYINGIKQIKVFETSPFWNIRFIDAITKFWNLYRKDSFWLKAQSSALNFVVLLIIAISLILMRFENPDNFSSIIPVFGTFVFAAFRLLPKLANFGNYRMGIMGALPNIEAIHETLIDTKYNTIKNGDNQLEELKDSIVFQNMNFTYQNRDETLKDVSLSINKGKVTAIVGESGSGKSTIADILLRMYDVDGGSIVIDSKNIKEYDISSFLRKIGYVSQETFIFNGSIKDNITFGNEYSMEEIEDASKLANTYDFIQEFPEKYETPVGDRGVKLSGGQKQRIAIARAMIRKPEILILDEATSSLDNVSEKIVQEAINEVSQKCTTLIIAHRLSTIMNADIIYLLDKGRIVESGNHDQLMEMKGQYWRLYSIQTK